MIDKPKPCPICDEERIEVVEEWDGWWRCVCPTCNRENIASRATIKEAVSDWNDPELRD